MFLPHYTYYVNGNQLTQTDPKGNTTSFAYDDLNRRVSRTLPSTVTDNPVPIAETWTCDSFGRTDVHTDFDGHATKEIYDTTPQRGGRLTEGDRYTGVVTATTPDERTVYTYDTLGRSSAVDEYAGASQTRHTTYSYDPITGSMTLVDSPEGQVHHAYDPATGQLIRTWTDHDDTRYTYDKLGRMDHVTAVELDDQTTNLVTDYQYDAVGNLHATTQENSAGTADDVVTSYGYDTLNRLSDEVTTRGGTTTLFSQQVVYDDNGDGQKQSTLEHTTDGQIVFARWTYDGDGRLLTETRDVGNDAQNTVTGDYVVTYAFDLSGNRTKQVTDKPGTADDQTLVSVFNVRDQLLSTGVDSNSDGVPDVATATTYNYDRNGSTLSETTGGATKKYT